MNSNTEAKSVRDIINSVMSSSLNMLVREYSKEQIPEGVSHYRIKSILNKDDKDPSMWVYPMSGKWKCFSSGYGGGYLELLYRLRQLDDPTVNYYELVNEVVRSNPILRKKCKKYLREQSNIEIPHITGTINTELRSYKRKQSRPLCTVGSEMRKAFQKKDFDLLYRCVLLFQQNQPLNEEQAIEVFDTSKESKDINDLLRGLDL